MKTAKPAPDGDRGGLQKTVAGTPLMEQTCAEVNPEIERMTRAKLALFRAWMRDRECFRLAFCRLGREG
jgi:hypothetical protein